MKKFRTLIIPFTFLIPALILFSFNKNPGILETILLRIQAFHSKNPQEKLYIHFDKPFYAAGDSIWFKAYLVEASLHSLDSQSRVIYVEIMNRKKELIDRKTLFAEGGVSFGNMKLPDTLKQDNYLIRAYTNFMKNAGPDFFFMKEISVLGPSVNAPVATRYNADSISLQFFPEGGNLVALSAANRVAFKALSPDGKSINVNGDIVDESNNIIASFQSAHNGMGIVKFTPTVGKKYYAHITKPYAINRPYPLPEVQSRGYVMQIDEIGKNVKVVVFANEDKPADGKLKVSIVAQSRGRVYHAQNAEITSTAYFTYIPRSKFPDGITQITLFDSKGVPIAERLLYVDQEESITIKARTDTLKYGKRAPVIIYIDAAYRDGTPAAGNFSVSVYNDELMSPTEEFPLTIQNYLALTSDLKGHIENPGYYFKDSKPETKKNLDLLMMVNGWRRFTWKAVLADYQPDPDYNRERGVPISGQVLKTLGKRPPAESVLKIMTMKGNAIILKPDSSGRFYSDELLYYDTLNLIFQTENEKGKKQPYKFLLDPPSRPPMTEYSLTSLIPFDASLYIKQQSEANLAFNTSNVTVLKEVEIREKKEIDSRLIGSAGGRVVDLKKLNVQSEPNIFSILQSKVPGVIVTGTPPGPIMIEMRGGAPTFLLNGSPSDIDVVGSIAPSDIEFIEVVNGAARYGAAHAINVVLKKGVSGDRVPLGINQTKYPGFYRTREFYSPRYDVPDNRHNLPDKRTTLFWEPMVVTDGNGSAGISFYTGDVDARYKIVIEGITRDGYPGTTTATFEVKK